MSDANLRQIRVLHIVSSGALASSLQQSLFMPLLTRLPRPRVKSLVACLSPGAVPSAVLRQSGVPTYDLALSRKRFSPRAFQELQHATRNFRPDVIQAWGHTAQIISALLRPRCEWKPRLIWNIADTVPIAKDAGFIDRQKLQYAAKFANRADRIVYSSEAAAAAHRRVGFPEGQHEMIPPGVDATRFKPDFAARRKLREQLNLPGETFVIGMYAPFQPEYDFSTLIRGVGELIKANPHVALVLAGHGVQKGNAPLMALIGGGALATRVHLLGEWSDISALYNACDVVCSSALNDQSRMNIVMGMLCGVPCVATGMGAQGEVIAQHGVAIEPGNPAAFVRGLTRVMQMTPEKRTFMAQGARKHALANYVHVRSLQKYLQVYYDLIGRPSLVSQDLPTPEIDPTLTVPPALPTESEINASKRKPPSVAEWGGDPDSLESKVTEREPEELPKWRIEQEQERAKREADLAAQVAATQINGDVLQVFETAQASAQTIATPMTERARGVADDSEELLSADLLTAEVPVLPRASNAPSSPRKNSTAAQAASSAPPTDAVKQAALKAARMAALQPIAQAAKQPSAARPAAVAAKLTPVVTPMAIDPGLDFNSTQPVLLAASELLHASPAPVKAEKVDVAVTQRVEALAKSAAKPAKAAAPVQDPIKVVEKRAAANEQVAATAPTVEKFKTVDAAQSIAQRPQLELTLAADVPAVAQKSEAVASPLGRLAKALASANVTQEPAAPAAQETVRAQSKPKRPVADEAKASAGATASMTAALEKWNSSFDLGDLSLMATGVWAAAPRSNTAAKPTKDETPDELSGAEALSLISASAEQILAPTDATLKLEVLAEPATEPKLAVNAQ